MKVDISHSKNPAVGWDVAVSVNDDKNEGVAYVEVDVDDFPEVKESLDPPVQQWSKQLTQQGQFPGDNKVLVKVASSVGNQTRWVQEWG